MSLEFEMPFAASIFMLMLCFVYFNKRRLDILENRYFDIILIGSAFETIFSTVCHVIYSICGANLLTSSIYPFIIIINKFICFDFIFIFSGFFAYIMTISYNNLRDEIKQKKFHIVLRIILFIFLLLIMFTDINLIKYDNVTNVEGYSIIITYVGAAYFLVQTFCLAFIKRNTIDKRYYSIFYFAGILIILLYFSIMIPALLVYELGLTMFCYIMYFTIENPDFDTIRELNIAKDSAIKANEAKTDFLSNMSHEIRTPLNAIVGFSECIADSKTLNESKENAKDIITASNTLLEIVNGILDISKIETGKMEIENKKYDVMEMLNYVKDLSIVRIGEKNINFNVKFSSDLPKYLYGDQINIKKILFNLISNAIKYTNEGYINFNVDCIYKKDVCRLIISVEDSGRGIKPEQIDKLFTKFQRLDEDRNTTLEGTGLGLAITKQLIELMGGKIVVQSKFSEGSKFTVSLDQIMYKVKEEEKIITFKDNSDFSNKKVLIVDDNQMNLKIADRLLKKYEIVTFLSDSGENCLEKIKSDKYDLILMDDMMPHMTGTETMKKIHEDSSFHTPIVVLTANAIVGMKEKYIEDGFNDYLSKPIIKNDLDKILNKYLGNM